MNLFFQREYFCFGSRQCCSLSHLTVKRWQNTSFKHIAKKNIFQYGMEPASNCRVCLITRIWKLFHCLKLKLIMLFTFIAFQAWQFSCVKLNVWSLVSVCTIITIFHRFMKCYPVYEKLFDKACNFNRYSKNRLRGKRILVRITMRAQLPSNFPTEHLF